MDSGIDQLRDEFLDEEHAAAFCRVKRNTLRAWSALRKGPPRIKVGRKIFYRTSSLKAWLEAQEVAPRRG